MGERRGAYRVLVGQTRGKKTTWTTQGWEDNTKMDVQKVGWNMD
jgi:hypothetical protein